MKVFIYAVFGEVVIAGLVLSGAIKDFLWTHPWWHSFLVAIPAVAVPIIAVMELRHSGEIVELTKERRNLEEQLDGNRNIHLGDIAEHVKPPISVTEKNAVKLRKYIDQFVLLNGSIGGRIANEAQIVEIDEDNIAWLFFPMNENFADGEVYLVDCGQMEIVEIPYGSCPLRVKINKLHGSPVKLPGVARWDDRNKPVVKPAVEKGHFAWQQNFIKPNSSETRALRIFGAKDDSNNFILEADPNGVFTGNNVEISKRASSLRIDYLDEGFKSSGYGTGVSSYPLYLERI